MVVVLSDTWAKLIWVRMCGLRLFVRGHTAVPFELLVSLVAENAVNQRPAKLTGRASYFVPSAY